MSLTKMFATIVCVFSISVSVFAEDKIKGESSHNGVTKEMTPDEVQKKIAHKKAIKAAKKELKKDGKFSKEDRKKIKKMKKAANVGASEDVPPPKPTKDTEQMIDDADAEPDMEDPQDDTADE